MYMEQSKTAIPMRKARATLAKLVTDGKPVTLLTFNWPAAILVPLSPEHYLRASERGKLRRRLRTQFEALLMEALPKGE